MVGTPAIFFIDTAKLPNFPERCIPISRGKVKKNQPKTKTYTNPANQKHISIPVLIIILIQCYYSPIAAVRGVAHAHMPSALATVIVSSWGDSWGPFSSRVVMASQRSFRTATHFFDETPAADAHSPIATAATLFAPNGPALLHWPATSTSPKR
ncbi:MULTISPECIES: hypothetical protein [Comamonas]|uniref:hypothetical protein n=1 Tax=Comamonas TaxID=283 RepID=UPI0015FA6339|nr:hypothetical protein [Comamonas koreensis]